MSETDRSAASRRQEVVQFFNHGTGWWNDIYNEDLPKGFFNYEVIKRRELLLESLRDRFHSQSNGRILDCGCGPGGVLRKISPPGWQVFGLDINQAALKAVAEQDSRTAGLVNADVETLPFQSQSFDVICCIGVLCYLRRDNRAMAELARILKPGGCLFFSVPNLLMINKLADPYYYLYGYLRYLSRWRKAQQGTENSFETGLIRRYRFKQLQQLFEDERLSLRETRCVSFGPFTLWRRQILPLQRSIDCSETLLRWSQGWGDRLLRRLTNHWIMMVEKP